MSSEHEQWPLGRPRRAEQTTHDAEEDWVPHETNPTLQRNRLTGKLRTRPGYTPPDPPIDYRG